VAMLIAPTQAAGALNEANNEGATPLMHASLRGLCGVVELLLAAGADVATKDEDGFTALMLACKEKKEEAAALLMEATMNAGALDVQHTKYKLSALHYASSSGLESIVAKLLSLGADVALKDKEGNSCLHIAAAQGSNEILRILLNAVAEVSAKNKWCKTAYDVATNDEVKAALRQHGTRHSLFYAAEQGMLELVADLIKEGADVNERNQAGNTAVERAQNAQTIDVLKGAGATMPEFPEARAGTRCG